MSEDAQQTTEEGPREGRVARWLGAQDLRLLAPLALLLALAPMHPQPHLVEKLGMLASGTLVRPLDIFDLLMHASGLVIVALKLGHTWRVRQRGVGAVAEGGDERE